ncbi:hypothetical protein X975_26554, partial [Stegodyphus mimosarum]
MLMVLIFQLEKQTRWLGKLISKILNELKILQKNLKKPAEVERTLHSLCKFYLILEQLRHIVLKRPRMIICTKNIAKNTIKQLSLSGFPQKETNPHQNKVAI